MKHFFTPGCVKSEDKTGGRVGGRAARAMSFSWPTPSIPIWAASLFLLQPSWRGVRRANGAVQGCPRVQASGTRLHMPVGEGSKMGRLTNAPTTGSSGGASPTQGVTPCQAPAPTLQGRPETKPQRLWAPSTYLRKHQVYLCDTIFLSGSRERRGEAHCSDKELLAGAGSGIWAPWPVPELHVASRVWGCHESLISRAGSWRRAHGLAGSQRLLGKFQPYGSPEKRILASQGPL